MFRTRFWKKNTIVSYWHDGVKYAISMPGHYETLDEMAAAAASGVKYILRIVKRLK